MLPAIKRAFDSRSDLILKLSTENDALKNKKGSHDQQLIEECKATLLKQIEDEKTANLFMSRRKKTDGKTIPKKFLSKF